MKRTASNLLRWSAILALVGLLAVLIPMTWLAEKTTGGGLWAAKRVKRELQRLLREVR